MIITEKKSKLISFLIYALSAVILIIDHKIVLAGIREGLAVCARYIVPSLFMLCVVCTVLISSPYADNLFTGVLSRVFGLGQKSGVSVFFGLIAGFPSGAMGACELYENGLISKRDCEKIVYFTNNAGLAFIIGTVGALMRDHRFAVILWIAQTLASLTLTNLFRGKEREVFVAKTLRRDQISLVDAVKKGAVSMLTVCAFVCFFTAVRLLIVNILENYIKNAVGLGFIISFLEIGNAVGYASTLSRHANILCSFSVGFGGLSAILQSVAVCPCVRISRYVIARILMGVLCVGYTLLISTIVDML